MSSSFSPGLVQIQSGLGSLLNQQKQTNKLTHQGSPTSLRPFSPDLHFYGGARGVGPAPSPTFPTGQRLHHAARGPFVLCDPGLLSCF